MRKYYVHYEVNLLRQHMRMIMPIDAESEAEAIEICKADRPGSYGHRINVQKSEPTDKEEFAIWC
tara:strand:- start:229 stop:423 length:195 start_codon:yes stop_codon:yes gene_type:complete